MYKRIIWATDGTPGADAALEQALRLRELSGGRLIAVHCDQRLTGRTGPWSALVDEQDRRTKIGRQVDDLNLRGVPIELVVRRSHHEAADAVASVAAEQKADAIVCGTRGFGPITGAFLGSFTQRLLSVAPCPVLAVPVQKVVAREPERETVGAHA